MDSIMSAPDRAIGPGATDVMMAVIAGARLYSEIMVATGLSRSCVWKHLRRLQRAGLVDWAPGTRGTLRPLVGPLP